MQCSGVDTVSGCLCLASNSETQYLQIETQLEQTIVCSVGPSVWVVMQCSGFDALFKCGCNVQVLMQCSGFMHCLGVDAICSVQSFMSCIE